MDIYEWSNDFFSGLQTNLEAGDINDVKVLFCRNANIVARLHSPEKFTATTNTKRGTLGTTTITLVINADVRNGKKIIFATVKWGVCLNRITFLAEVREGGYVLYKFTEESAFIKHPTEVYKQAELYRNPIAALARLAYLKHKEFENV